VPEIPPVAAVSSAEWKWGTVSMRDGKFDDKKIPGKTTLETSGEDVKLHSKRVERM
jgi:hypothetical protein